MGEKGLIFFFNLRINNIYSEREGGRPGQTFYDLIFLPTKLTSCICYVLVMWSYVFGYTGDFLIFFDFLSRPPPSYSSLFLTQKTHLFHLVHPQE